MENFGGQAPQESVSITKEQVIEQIVADPENIELLGKFVDQLQIKVDQGNFTLLDYSQTLAELYAEAARQNPQWKGPAADNFYDAATLANQVGDETLCSELLGRMKEFE